MQLMQISDFSTPYLHVDASKKKCLRGGSDQRRQRGHRNCQQLNATQRAYSTIEKACICGYLGPWKITVQDLSVFGQRVATFSDHKSIRIHY